MTDRDEFGVLGEIASRNSFVVRLSDDIAISCDRRPNGYLTRHGGDARLLERGLHAESVDIG
jgi:hypothetical protein